MYTEQALEGADTSTDCCQYLVFGIFAIKNNYVSMVTTLI